MDDYALIMSIMNLNLNEGYAEFPPREIVERPQSRSVHQIGTQQEVYTMAESVVEPQKVCESLKMNFQFDGVIINLMEG